MGINSRHYTRAISWLSFWCAEQNQKRGIYKKCCKKAKLFV